MELYLSACSKTANVAASKAATSKVAEDSQQCGDVSTVASGWCGCPGPQANVDMLGLSPGSSHGGPESSNRLASSCLAI